MAREGIAVNAEQAYFLQILVPILTHYQEAADIYAPKGHVLAEGEHLPLPRPRRRDRAPAEPTGAEPFYAGEIGAAVSDWVLERGGTLGRDDLGGLRPDRARARCAATYRGRQMLTNPPPSSGGVLIAYALAILERLGEPDLESVVGAMEAAQAARTEAFLEGLRAEGFEREFLDSAGVAQAASMVADRRQALEGPIRPDDRLGSTTHITAVDGDGRCASVTCSNGTGSGLIVPGTGVHVNNMLGEEDLNPRGVPPPPSRAHGCRR